MGVINAFPGYEFIDGKNMYRGTDVGKGGYVYAEPGMYKNRGDIAIPTAQYFNTILYGYQFFDMDLSYLMNRKGLQTEKL